MSTLQDKFPLPRDNDISMDVPTHTYTVNGKVYRGSVSTFLKEFFDKFDMNTALDSILRSKKINSPDYEYFGMNRQDIINYWGKGTNDGTVLHSCIEDYYNGIVTHFIDEDGLTKVKAIGEIGTGNTYNKEDKIKMYNSIEYGYFKNFLH